MIHFQAAITIDGRIVGKVRLTISRDLAGKDLTKDDAERLVEGAAKFVAYQLQKEETDG